MVTVSKVQYKVFMLITKYLMFFVSILYFITSLNTCLGLDNKYLLLLVKVPAWIVLYGVLLSKVLKFCFVHRLPLYYMLVCNLIFIIRSHIALNDNVYLWAVCMSFILYISVLFIYQNEKHNKAVNKALTRDCIRQFRCR